MDSWLMNRLLRSPQSNMANLFGFRVLHVKARYRADCYGIPDLNAGPFSILKAAPFGLDGRRRQQATYERSGFPFGLSQQTAIKGAGKRQQAC